jgi:hypothetical protein
MVQIIISLISGFLATVLKLVIKDPASVAAESTVIHNIAEDTTNMDTLVSGGTWVYTAPTPATANAAKAAMKSKLGG